MYKGGDQVRIIQRKPYNETGTSYGWNEPDGNVGDIGIIETSLIGGFIINNSKGDYLGIFDKDDIEFVSQEPQYEIY